MVTHNIAVSAGLWCLSRVRDVRTNYFILTAETNDSAEDHYLSAMLPTCYVLFLVGPVFLKTIYTTNTLPKVFNYSPCHTFAVMDTWFKFTPVAAVHKGVLGRKRKPESRLTKKLRNNSDKINSLQPLDQIDNCCRHECYKKHTNLHTLQHLRNHYWSFTKDTARKAWFKELLLPHVPDDLDPDQKQFTLNDVPVCYNFIKTMFGCSNNMLIGIKGTQYAQAHISIDPSRQSRTGIAAHHYDFTKREEVVLWLNYQRQFYELQPDRDEVLLPWSFKGEVYRQYTINPNLGNNPVTIGRDPCTLQYFLLVWKEDVPGLKCRRFHRFMICDTCSTLNAKLLCRAIEGEARILYQKAKDRHIQDVKEDRYFYGMRIMEAKQFPNDIWSMVIDGSDTSQWGIPHPAQRTHESQKGKKLQCHIYGVIVHGHFAACYVLNSHLPGGTNVTIECLHRTFLKLLAQGKKFPPKLNLQLDNTSKDNKSRFVVAYLYMLVSCGCFDEIEVFFFEVGHTHCDADQLFSRTSIFLCDKDIWNFELLCQFVLNSCALIEFVEMIDSLVPWKQNIEKYLVPKHQSAGIQMYRLLRIKREGTEVKYQVKRSVHDFNGKWHDYKAREGECQAVTENNILLTSDIYDTFDQPYVIPPLPLTDGKELEYREHMTAVNGCAQRIHMAYADIQESAPIVQSLVDEVEAMRRGKVCPFNWDVSIYKNPQRRIESTVLEMSEEERNDYNHILRRKAVDKLYRITNGEPLEMDEIEELCMLIVRADPDDSNKFPFWVAEVGKIDKDRNSNTYKRVQVCWYTPIKRQSNALTPEQYLHAKFSPEVSARTDRRDKQAAHKAVKRVVDWIELDCIVVVFSHLLAGGKLPKKVQEKLLGDNFIKEACGLVGIHNT